MKTFSLSVLFLIILGGSNFATYKYTIYFNERAAIKEGFGYYNELLDFQWKPKINIAADVIREKQKEIDVKNKEEIKKQNIQPLNPKSF